MPKLKVLYMFNLYAVKVKLLIIPLFLPKGNAILPITPEAVRGGGHCLVDKSKQQKQTLISDH